MSKLNDLIQQLCPDGVNHQSFFDCATYIRGVSYGKSMEVNNGDSGYRLLRANNIDLEYSRLSFDDVKVVDYSVNVKESQFLKKDDILICAGSGSKEHIGKVAYIFKDMDYTFGGFMGVIRVDKETLLPRYLFHILTGELFHSHLRRTSGGNSSTINNINNSTWEFFKFPVPPLEVQSEIVKILDNFAELTAKLTAELTARNKQYEYYRDKLLSFKEKKNA